VIYASCSHEVSFKQTQNFNNHSPEASRKDCGSRADQKQRKFDVRWSLECRHSATATRCPFGAAGGHFLTLGARLVEIADDTRLQIVNRRSDLNLPGTDARRDELARGHPLGGSPRAFLGGIIDPIAGNVSGGKRCRQDGLDHVADRAGIGRILADDIARRLDRAAAGVGKNDD
jgi:hypothetical protein